MCVECFCFAAWPDDDDAAAAADDDVVGTGWCADDGDGDNLFHFGDFLCFFLTDVLHDDEELCFDLEKLMLENYVEIKWIILLILIFFSFQCVWVDVFICLHLF